MNNPSITRPDRPMLLRDFKDLPAPRGIPIIGNLLQLDSSRLHMHLQLEKWCDEFGDIFALRLGKQRMVVVGDHLLIATALRDRPDGFRRIARLEQVRAEMGLPGGVFGANGDMWRRQRRMVMAAFDPAHVKRYFPSLQRVSLRLAERWRTAAQQGATIELQSDLMRFTVDTIAGLAFGAEVNTLQSNEDVIQVHLNRIFPALFRRTFAPFPTWRWFPSREDRELGRSVLKVNAAIEGFIAQARARLQDNCSLRGNPRNLLEAMLVAAEEPGSGIDDQQVAGNILTMLLAGEETTANTLAWMVYMLWQHPEALARVTEELRRVCGDAELPTLEQLDQLDYVEACAHEAMRLKPAAPLIALQALRPTALGDVLIEEGMGVMLLMRQDAVSERHVSAAGTFDPTRWLVSADRGQARGTLKRLSMPFGAGPRVCPGRYLALHQMKMAMATLLLEFDIESVSMVDQPRKRFQLTMAPDGLTMRLRQRRDDSAGGQGRGSLGVF